jgi:hypothetical protein
MTAAMVGGPGGWEGRARDRLGAAKPRDVAPGGQLLRGVFHDRLGGDQIVEVIGIGRLRGELFRRETEERGIVANGRFEQLELRRELERVLFDVIPLGHVNIPLLSANSTLPSLILAHFGPLARKNSVPEAFIGISGRAGGVSRISGDISRGLDGASG